LARCRFAATTTAATGAASGSNILIA